MMKRFIPLLLIVFACNCGKGDLKTKAEREIRAADVAMSAMAVKEGYHKALLAYADDSVIKFGDMAFPSMGKAELAKKWEGSDGPKSLSWEPFKVQASASGDLGYTAGYWKYVTDDTTEYGTYFTAWKRQADGNWKYVLDGGNNTPAPPQK